MGPKRARIVVASTRSTTTTSKTSRDAPNSTRSGTPAVSRNVVSAIPLSISSSPTIWETALRRVASMKKPMRTVATPMGASRAAVPGARAVTFPLAR